MSGNYCKNLQANNIFPCLAKLSSFACLLFFLSDSRTFSILLISSLLSPPARVPVIWSSLIALLRTHHPSVQLRLQDKMAFLLSLFILFPLSVLSKSDPDNLFVHLHSNKSKVRFGRIWYLTIFQKGLHIQPSELEGASKHTAAGHIGDNTQNIARSTTDPEYWVWNLNYLCS